MEELTWVDQLSATLQPVYYETQLNRKDWANKTSKKTTLTTTATATRTTKCASPVLLKWIVWKNLKMLKSPVYKYLEKHYFPCFQQRSSVKQLICKFIKFLKAFKIRQKKILKWSQEKKYFVGAYLGPYLSPIYFGPI